MARQSNELLLAWSSMSREELGTGWQAISLVSAGQLKLMAGRRFPENAEAVLVGFPSKSLGGPEKLPEGQGFAVERVDLEDTEHLENLVNHLFFHKAREGKVARVLY